MAAFAGAHSSSSKSFGSSSEQTSSSQNSSTCDSSSLLVLCEKSHRACNLPGTHCSVSEQHNSMDPAFFQNWQAQRQAMDAHMVPDSLSPFVPQAPHPTFLDSQSQHVLSNEEFQRLMEEPASNFQGNSRAGSSRLQNVSSFSCPPVLSNSSVLGPSPAATATEELHRVDPQKRPKKSSAKKAPKKPRVSMTVSDDEGEGDGEDSGDRRWTDGEVQQLISLRSEMDAEFQSNAKKQGVHMWDRLLEKMVAACDGFNKSAEAIRKKWKTVYRQYCTDKRILNVSGEGRKVSSKWFDEIDQGFNNRANVRKFCHGDSRGTQNPCPPDLNEPGEENPSADMSFADRSDAGTKEKTSPPSGKSSKTTSNEMYTQYMGEMVSSTSEIAKDIRESTAILKELKDSFNRLVDKL